MRMLHYGASSNRLPNIQPSSRIALGPFVLIQKFIPYTPTMNVSGMKIVAMMVSTRITSFKTIRRH